MKDKIRIGLLIIATGKYDQFIKPLIESVKKYFFTDHPGNMVTIYCWTNYEYIEKSLTTDNPKLVVASTNYYGQVSFVKEHEPWPLPTLHRYKTFMSQKTRLEQETDYLFYVDVDALFIKRIGREILPDNELDNGIDKLVCIQHCGFPNGGYGSHNTPKESKAWLEEEFRTNYYMGGFQGGFTKDFLDMCRILDENIEYDKSIGVMAEWHDESHFNTYISKNPDLFKKRLPPTFFMAEEMEGAGEKASILALKKDHAAIRS